LADYHIANAIPVEIANAGDSKWINRKFICISGIFNINPKPKSIAVALIAVEDDLPKTIYAPFAFRETAKSARPSALISPIAAETAPTEKS
jgi:hypothetical protein